MLFREIAQLVNAAVFAVSPVVRIWTVPYPANLLCVACSFLDITNDIISAVYQADPEYAALMMLRALLGVILLSMFLQRGQRRCGTASETSEFYLPHRNRFVFTPSSIPARPGTVEEVMPIYETASPNAHGGFLHKMKPQTAPVLAALLAVSPVPSNASPILHAEHAPTFHANPTLQLVSFGVVVLTKLAECYNVYFMGELPYQILGETLAMLVATIASWKFVYLFNSISWMATVLVLDIVGSVGVAAQLWRKSTDSPNSKTLYGSIEDPDPRSSLYDSFDVDPSDKVVSVQTVEQV
ncbi:hypothetical protein OGAPHI_002777 [Ogataea philodendri]|uniref:Uncharacterized protein n=1 Tax=Ogataea philodendri TaxID=1378263 RepID=A0A9P8T5L0_9ASCO|nr:uncharacterized protein OGAPHI_002777 [Ogataea philodendri]KAH3667128.1 hypothetical protein OGAPHI_002777 [Ogataea philodendri]